MLHRLGKFNFCIIGGQMARCRNKGQALCAATECPPSSIQTKFEFDPYFRD